MAGDDVNLPTDENNYFSLEEKIGSGAFSSVYVANDKKTSGRVAIKIFKQDHKYSSFLSQIASEIAFMLFMDHPHIMKVLMYDIGKPYTFVGMNYSQFGGLDKFIFNSQSLPEPYVKTIMKQLISAVNYLHGLNIFHGDIKPANIIVFRKEPSFVIQLSDFGLSEVIMDKQQVEPKKAGSLFYMAPELLLKFPYNLSADIFSMGVVMYHALFGTVPFDPCSRGTHTIYLRKRLPILKPAVMTSKRISPECFDFLRRLLDYDKSKRPIGDALKNHPFIGGVKTYPSPENLYVKACNCITKSFALIETLHYGKAFVQITEGILLLKIHSIRIQDDEDMCAYMKHRINTYMKFAKNLEIPILYNNEKFSVNINMTDDSLRCMLTSTPVLLNGYDMCIVGEMYVNQGKISVGKQKIENGLEILVKHLNAEPAGQRRNMLYGKMTEWMQLLERIKSKAPTAPSSPK